MANTLSAISALLTEHAENTATTPSNYTTNNVCSLCATNTTQW